MDDVIITVTDIRRAGYCAIGIRRWFEQNGLDFPHMLKHGIPATELAATGDAMALRVVAMKLGEPIDG